MSSIHVARKDVLDVRRAKIVWFVVGIYVLVSTLFIYWARSEAAFMQVESEILVGLWNLVFMGALFVPAVALVAAYLAIAGERESGSIKHLLSTPISRRDVVIGKFLSRGAIVSLSIFLAILVGTGMAVLWYGSLEPAALIGVSLIMTLYALAYVAVAVAISGATATRARAMGGVLAFYFVTNILVLFDDLSIIGAVDYVLNQWLGLGIGDDPIQLFGMVISPTYAYLGSATMVFPDSFLQQMGAETSAGSPWYLQPEVALVFLLAWILVPLALGIRGFERADLG